jgi:hypothetical protein
MEMEGFTVDVKGLKAAYQKAVSPHHILLGDTGKLMTLRWFQKIAGDERDANY